MAADTAPGERRRAGDTDASSPVKCIGQVASANCGRRLQQVPNIRVVEHLQQQCSKGGTGELGWLEPFALQDRPDRVAGISDWRRSCSRTVSRTRFTLSCWRLDPHWTELLTRIRSAIPRVSLRSVLLRKPVLSAADACVASITIAGNPMASNPRASHAELIPASRPTRRGLLQLP